MSFDDHADVVAGTAAHLGVPSPEGALRGFNLGTHVTVRLVWVNPDAATPLDDED